MQGLLFVLGLVTAGVAFIGIVLLANRLLAPHNPSSEKGAPFECGLDQAGDPWATHKLRFSAIAMLFVLFDAEAILLFAVAPRLRGNPVAVVEVGGFALFLLLGLVYAWRKGALEWRS